MVTDVVNRVCTEKGTTGNRGVIQNRKNWKLRRSIDTKRTEYPSINENRNHTKCPDKSKPEELNIHAGNDTGRCSHPEMNETGSCDRPEINLNRKMLSSGNELKMEDPDFEN